MVLDEAKIKEAWELAELHHEDQTYGSYYYTRHLQDVTKVLLNFGYAAPELLVAAILHDTLEDTGLAYNEIRDRFGLIVAELVYAVTDERGRNRKERHAKTYPKIAAFSTAITLKLADRIANVEFCLRKDADDTEREKSKFDMYKKEHAEFRLALYDHGGPSEMWDYLESLMTRTPDGQSQLS